MGRKVATSFRAGLIPLFSLLFSFSPARKCGERREWKVDCGFGGAAELSIPVWAPYVGDAVEVRKEAWHDGYLRDA